VLEDALKRMLKPTFSPQHEITVQTSSCSEVSYSCYVLHAPNVECISCVGSNSSSEPCSQTLSRSSDVNVVIPKLHENIDAD
jgi:hypothetical protein